MGDVKARVKRRRKRRRRRWWWWRRRVAIIRNIYKHLSTLQPVPLKRGAAAQLRFPEFSDPSGIPIEPSRRCRVEARSAASSRAAGIHALPSLILRRRDPLGVELENKQQ